MIRVKKALTATARAMHISSTPPLGAMIETPAAALSMPELRGHADFVSIGTNDLTQYTMAAGRENPAVNGYFRDDHPAVIRLISMVAAGASGMPVSICGELAGNEKAVARIIDAGITSLSVAPQRIPRVKSIIRSVNLC